MSMTLARTSALVARPQALNLASRPLVRTYAQEAKGAFSRHAERRRTTATLKDAVSAPSKGTAFSLGQGALAGGAALGLGSLVFYGLGLSNEVGAVDKAVAWPEYVRHRIRDTYGYFAASIGVTAATAVGIFRTPALLNIVARQGLVSMFVAIAALVGTGAVVRSIPYEPGLGTKQLAWPAHCAVVGAVVAPICFLGGPILTRAAWYTAGMVGGLSTVAACAPSEKFLTMGGPLAMGFGVVLVSSLGTAFLPPTTALGAGLWSVALYGGLILFGGVILYDPVNNSISIYADTVNIFIRIAQILAMGGGMR